MCLETARVGRQYWVVFSPFFTHSPLYSSLSWEPPLEMAFIKEWKMMSFSHLLLVLLFATVGTASRTTIFMNAQTGTTLPSCGATQQGACSTFPAAATALAGREGTLSLASGTYSIASNSSVVFASSVVIHGPATGGSAMIALSQQEYEQSSASFFYALQGLSISYVTISVNFSFSYPIFTSSGPLVITHCQTSGAIFGGVFFFTQNSSSIFASNNNFSGGAAVWVELSSLSVSTSIIFENNVLSGVSASNQNINTGLGITPLVVRLNASIIVSQNTVQDALLLSYMYPYSDHGYYPSGPALQSVVIQDNSVSNGQLSFVSLSSLSYLGDSNFNFSYQFSLSRNVIFGPGTSLGQNLPLSCCIYFDALQTLTQSSVVQIFIDGTTFVGNGTWQSESLICAFSDNVYYGGNLYNSGGFAELSITNTVLRGNGGTLSQVLILDPSITIVVDEFILANSTLQQAPFEWQSNDATRVWSRNISTSLLSQVSLVNCVYSSGTFQPLGIINTFFNGGFDGPPNVRLNLTMMDSVFSVGNLSTSALMFLRANVVVMRTHFNLSFVTTNIQFVTCSDSCVSFDEQSTVNNLSEIRAMQSQYTCANCVISGFGLNCGWNGLASWEWVIIAVAILAVVAIIVLIRCCIRRSKKRLQYKAIQ